MYDTGILRKILLTSWIQRYTACVIKKLMGWRKAERAGARRAVFLDGPLVVQIKQALLKHCDL